MTDHDAHGAGADDGPGPAAAPARTGRRTSRRTPAAPAARFDPGRVAEPRHRNPTWLLAGVLLVVLSALGGVLLFTSNDDRTEVLVAATALEPGQPLERSDLRIQRVALDGGVASIDPADAPELVGLITVGQVPAGTMLAPGMFADDAALGPDEMVVGAALDPGEAPVSGMQVGSPVELLALNVPQPGQTTATTPTDPATGSAAPVTGATATLIGPGTVWAVEPIATGQVWVSMRVSRQVGLAASLASAQDALRVVLVGAGG
ncbi:MAG: SAF domain-containing protein [Ilumatobacteraceae bacterium]